ncbi:MAG: NIPSNAP family protein [Ktedonobacteraceae bacterium]|jgi:NIPSNAP protein|nr:NIPSNAP family protein [Ktedonobacteraceae bacterium]
MSDTNAQGLGQQPGREAYSSIVELRQYTLRSGRREDLITLFEEHFIEGQEQCGMHILGQFRQRSRPDQFVWLRGFPDMEGRRQALQSFYYGPIWQEHRNAANDTMIDSDNVLLLKPAGPRGSIHLDLSERPGKDAPEIPRGLVLITLYAFASPVEVRFIEFFEQEMAPVLRSTGAPIRGYFVAETSKNTFPALPVREGEHIFTWLATFADEATYRSYRRALQESQAWTTSILPVLQQWLMKPEDVLELFPTRRSLMGHR